MLQKRVVGGTGKNGQQGFCSLRSSRWPKATLFTFLFTYTTVSVHRNFVLLPVSVASPLNNITLIPGIYEQNMTVGPLNVPEYSNLSLTRVTVVKEGRYLDLGTSGLMLNIITPLQKFSKGGTTITDVIQQRYLDLYGRQMTSSLMKRIEESFTSKKVSCP